MEADVSAGLPAKDPVLKKIRSGTTDSAEGDLTGKSAAMALLNESPPTDGELVDAMSKIQDFFALEGTFTQLNVLQSGTSRSRGTNASNASHTSPAASASPSPFEIRAVAGSQPFGPLSDRPACLTPSQASKHRGDSMPSSSAKAEGIAPSSAVGALLGLRATPTNSGRVRSAEEAETATEPKETLSSPLLETFSSPPRRNWRVDLEGEEEVPPEGRAGDSSNGRWAGGDATAIPQAPRGDGFSDRTTNQKLGKSVENFPLESSELEDFNERSSDAPGLQTGLAAIRGQNSPSLAATSSTLGKAPPPSPGSPTSSAAASPNANFLWKMRLGITPTGTADDRSMRYLHIHEKGRDQFQQFAKSLIDQLSVECAESNPYVKALCAHRQEMLDSTLDLSKEVVDSLPARLGTERLDNLASMTISEEDTGPCDLDPLCHGREQGQHRFNGELYLPELEARHQRHLRNNGRFLPSPPSPTASTDRSTTAGSARSDPEARRVVFPSQANAEDRNAGNLRLRIGRNRLELSEADRFDFLSVLGEEADSTSAPPEVSTSATPIRTCGGDVAPDPSVDGD